MYCTGLTVLVGNMRFSPAVNCGASIALVYTPKPCWHVSASNRNTRTLFLSKKLPSGTFLTTCAHPLFLFASCASPARKQGLLRPSHCSHCHRQRSAPSRMAVTTPPSTPRGKSHPHTERKDRATEQQCRNQGQQWWSSVFCTAARCQRKCSQDTSAGWALWCKGKLGHE